MYNYYKIGIYEMCDYDMCIYGSYQNIVAN